MSNLKNKLKKTADAIGIETDLYLVLEKEIDKKAKEIGYTGDIEEVAALIDKNLGDHNTRNVADSIYIAIERWAEDAK